MSCMYGDIKNVILVILPLMQVSMLPQDSRQCASLPQDDRSGFTGATEAIQENCINLLPFFEVP